MSRLLFRLPPMPLQPRFGGEGALVVFILPHAVRVWEYVITAKSCDGVGIRNRHAFVDTDTGRAYNSRRHMTTLPHRLRPRCPPRPAEAAGAASSPASRWLRRPRRRPARPRPARLRLSAVRWPRAGH